MPAFPALLTFDIFGTVLDWRRGMTESLARRGIALGDAFDRVVDRQGALEQAAFAAYAEITARSLEDELGVSRDVAEEIGREVGDWPLFPDSSDALRLLEAHATCGAMTNSDRAHGERVRGSLGFPLTHWICAEDVRAYKPNPAFWEATRARTNAAFGPAWWHVSAYADYDLDVARGLGLTTVLIRRPHARFGPADLAFDDLLGLARHIEAIAY